MGTGTSKAPMSRSQSVKVTRKFSLKRRKSLKDFSPVGYIQRKNSTRKTISVSRPSLIGNNTGFNRGEHVGSNESVTEEFQPKIMEEVGTSEKFHANGRRRSLSDGQLPVTLQQVKDGYADKNEVTPRSRVEITIPARELRDPTLAGYLELQDGEGLWNMIWCVLKDNTLYTYSAPIDDVTQDVLVLPGYHVIPCLPSNNKHVFQLNHPDNRGVTLSGETAEETESWMESLHVATQKLTLDSLNLDSGNSLQYQDRQVGREELEEEARKQWKRELLRLKKQQLLREVLQQKEQLTRQHKLHKAKASSFDEAMAAPVMEEGGEQLLRERAVLKQRKVSTQLKLESFQKELQSSIARTKTRRKGFKLPGKKQDKSPTSSLPGYSPDTEALEGQIAHLVTELEHITRTLEQLDARCSPQDAGTRRRAFAVGSMGSSDSAGSRDRSRSDLSISKTVRSEPNLLNLLQGLTLEGLQHEQKMDINTKVQLMSYTKIGSTSDIPMIDDSPSPTRSHKLKTSATNLASYSRQRSDPESKPVFSLHTPEANTGHSKTLSGGQTDYDRQIGSNCLSNEQRGGRLNKSCDMLDIQGYGRDGDLEDGVGKEGIAKRNVTRSKSETGNLKKQQISAAALAEIAAFEELVHQKMSLSPSTEYLSALR